MTERISYEKLKFAAVEILAATDPDPTREGILKTPDRVALAWQDWTEGYALDPNQFFVEFKDGAEEVDEMILVKDIPFYSHCEHHMAPFFGRVTVGYIPRGKIIGLSKISRIVDVFAHRFQVQERFTRQVANCLWQGLNPIGIGVLVRARHLCMESRGICKQGHTTTTQRLLGALRNEPETRAEFVSLARSDVPL